MLDGQQNGHQGAQADGNGQAQGNGHPFGGGSGGGVSITPIAFLVVNSSGVKLLHLDESTHLYEKILDVAPQAFEKIQAMLKKNKKDGAAGQKADDFDI